MIVLGAVLLVVILQWSELLAKQFIRHFTPLNLVSLALAVATVFPMLLLVILYALMPPHSIPLAGPPYQLLAPLKPALAPLLHPYPLSCL